MLHPHVHRYYVRHSPHAVRGGYPWRPLTLQLLFVLCRFAGFWCSVQAFGIRSPAPFTWLAAFGLAYAVGLVAFMLIKVLAPGFFARQDMRTPVRTGMYILMYAHVL